jgi:NAD(P)-dependent dehydrogenase (short-subunit alcohol dehydrogenase family)
MAGSGGTHADKVAVVTGGASGIGLGIVERFLRDGARVVSLDLQETKVDAGADRFLAVQGNVTVEADVQRAIDTAVDAFGGLDVMVCNAGIIHIGPVLDMDFATWKRVMDTNIDSIFIGAKAAARQMIRQGRGGSIINAASGAGRRGIPNLSSYCASKAAVISLTQALSVELAPHRIRVNSYAPGHTETPFWEGISKGFARVTGKTPEQVLEGFRNDIPWGRFGTPEDVAATVSWLASSEADFISGQAIAMNGAEMPY